ncbi:MAG: hypothetical protein LBR44_05560 [Clostridiales Family XIII bacterium]|jgi:flavodoxin|nr:hypothetical protein [Clostridiales Family XIII bacterium]
MAKAVLFYSLGGTTRKYCEGLAQSTGSDLIEVFEKKQRSKLSAFLPGCIQAAGGKASEIVPPDADISQYDDIYIAGPIWGGNPAPAVNAIIGLLPAGRRVILIVVSGRGGYTAQRAVNAIEARGCQVQGVVSPSTKEVLEMQKG